MKGYIVRGKDDAGRPMFAEPDGENGYEPCHEGDPFPIDSADAACFAKLEVEAAGCSAVRIFSVSDDGTETTLPSYEEALAALAELRAKAATLRETADACEDARSLHDAIVDFCAEVSK